MLHAIVRIIGFAALPDLGHDKVIEAGILLQNLEADSAFILEALGLEIVHQLDGIRHALRTADDIDVSDHVNGTHG